jgi:hypothetical protein
MEDTEGNKPFELLEPADAEVAVLTDLHKQGQDSLG